MGCFTGIAKYLLFFFNFLIVLCGILLIAFGSILAVNEGKGLKSFTDFSVSGFTIAVGVIIFFIAFLGCCGAIKENGCMLLTYAIILIVILILQVVLGALALVSVNKDKSVLEKDVRKSVEELFNKQNQDSINTVQETFKCCGVDGPQFWNIVLPNSCCDNSPCTIVNAYKEGCVSKFTDVITDGIKIIGGIAIGFAVVELVATIFAFCVRNNRK